MTVFGVVDGGGGGGLRNRGIAWFVRSQQTNIEPKQAINLLDPLVISDYYCYYCYHLMLC